MFRFGLNKARGRVAQLGEHHSFDYQEFERKDTAFFDKFANTDPRMRDRIVQVANDRALKSTETMIRLRRIAIGSTGVVLALLLVRSCDNDAPQAPSTPTSAAVDCAFSEDKAYKIQPNEGIEDFIYEIEGIDSADHPCFDEADVRVTEAIEGLHDYDQVWPGDTIYIPDSVETIPPATR